MEKPKRLIPLVTVQTPHGFRTIRRNKTTNCFHCEEEKCGASYQNHEEIKEHYKKQHQVEGAPVLSSGSRSSKRPREEDAPNIPAARPVTSFRSGSTPPTTRPRAQRPRRAGSLSAISFGDIMGQGRPPRASDSPAGQTSVRDLVINEREEMEQDDQGGKEHGEENGQEGQEEEKGEQEEQEEEKGEEKGEEKREQQRREEEREREREVQRDRALPRDASTNTDFEVSIPQMETWSYPPNSYFGNLPGRTEISTHPDIASRLWKGIRKLTGKARPNIGPEMTNAIRRISCMGPGIILGVFPLQSEWRLLFELEASLRRQNSIVLIPHITAESRPFSPETPFTRWQVNAPPTTTQLILAEYDEAGTDEFISAVGQMVQAKALRQVTVLNAEQALRSPGLRRFLKFSAHLVAPGNTVKLVLVSHCLPLDRERELGRKLGLGTWDVFRTYLGVPADASLEFGRFVDGPTVQSQVSSVVEELCSRTRSTTGLVLVSDPETPPATIAEALESVPFPSNNIIVASTRSYASTAHRQNSWILQVGLPESFAEYMAGLCSLAAESCVGKLVWRPGDHRATEQYTHGLADAASEEEYHRLMQMANTNRCRAMILTGVLNGGVGMECMVVGCGLCDNCAKVHGDGETPPQHQRQQEQRQRQQEQHQRQHQQRQPPPRQDGFGATQLRSWIHSWASITTILDQLKDSCIICFIKGTPGQQQHYLYSCPAFDSIHGGQVAVTKMVELRKECLRHAADSNNMVMCYTCGAPTDLCIKMRANKHDRGVTDCQYPALYWPALHYMVECQRNDLLRKLVTGISVTDENFLKWASQAWKSTPGTAGDRGENLLGKKVHHGWLLVMLGVILAVESRTHP